MSNQVNPTVRPRSKGTALITDASSSVGAIYADRLARRGHDLILVASERHSIDAHAAFLRDDTGQSVQVIVANLERKLDLRRIEREVRENARITLLVNNANSITSTALMDSDADLLCRIIDLNVIALMRLTHAIVPTYVRRGWGSIINLAPVSCIARETPNVVGGATRAFILAFSLALHKELSHSRIRIQAVLPGASATDFWDALGSPLEDLPDRVVTEAAELVDVAIAAFDEGELITVPSLPDIAECEAHEAARNNMVLNSFKPTKAQSRISSA
jgi:uncharacterized protein